MDRTCGSGSCHTANYIHDAFVSKISPDGQGSSDLVYSTYLGGGADFAGWGSCPDYGSDIAIDASNSIYIVGSTACTDFPITANAFQTTFPPNSGGIGFVIVLDPNGSTIKYSSYFTGPGSTINVDQDNNAYFAGIITNNNLPVTIYAYDLIYHGKQDIFASKLTTNQSFSSFLPKPNGYQFQNSSGHTSWEIFRDTYGTEYVDGKQAADKYYHNLYKCDGPDAIKNNCEEVGANGNCDGMAVSSMLLSNGWATPPDFLQQQGVKNTFSLTITNNVPAQEWPSTPVSDFIIRYQGYQYGRQVEKESSMAYNRTITDSLALIKAGIDLGLTEPQVIHIRGPVPWNQSKCAGHALMPYAYKTTGISTQISVYDPNQPNFFTQTVIITPTLNSWSYDHQNPIEVWGSNVRCFTSDLLYIQGSFTVVPVSAYKNKPIPPWPLGKNQMRKDQNPTTGGWYDLTAKGDSTLTIVDDQGRMAGNMNGQLVLDIPGSYLDIPDAAIPNQDIDYPARYIIPDTVISYTKVTHLDNDVSGLFAILPGGLCTVESSSSVTGTIDTISMTPDAGSVSAQASNEEHNLSLSLQREGVNYGRQVIISELELIAGREANISLSSNDSIVTFTSNSPQSGYQINLTQEAYTSTVFIGGGPSLEIGDIHIISLNWNNPVTVTVSIDKGGDGTIDQEAIIYNQVGRSKIFLPVLIRPTKTQTLNNIPLAGIPTYLMISAIILWIIVRNNRF